MATGVFKLPKLILGIKRKVRKLRDYVLSHDYREILPTSDGSFWYATVGTGNIMESFSLLGGLDEEIIRLSSP